MASCAGINAQKNHFDLLKRIDGQVFRSCMLINTVCDRVLYIMEFVLETVFRNLIVVPININL